MALRDDLKKTHSYLPTLAQQLKDGKVSRREFLRTATLPRSLLGDGLFDHRSARNRQLHETSARSRGQGHPFNARAANRESAHVFVDSGFDVVA